MTSKNSFLASIREDNKRRLWLWLTAVFMFVIVAPLFFLVMIAGIDEQSYILNYQNMAQGMIEQAVVGICEVMLGTNVFRLFIGGVFAVLAAFSGFYWLDDRIRVDFYASMPEKKSRRFFISIIGSVAMYVITSFISLVLCHAILGAFGYAGFYPASSTCRAFWMCLLFYLGTYFISVLAITLTGNVFASVCAIAVLSLYELMLRAIWIGYSGFHKYSYHLETDFIPSFTPWGSFAKAVIEEQYKGSIAPSSYLKIIILVLIVAVLAYLTYMYRPMEAAGKTLAYKALNIPLKFLLAIPGAVVVGLAAITISESDSSRYMAVVALVVIISAVIICAIIEAVFELDVKAVLAKKIHWVITAVCAIAIFFMLKEDVLGINRYIPDKSSVESVAIVPSDFLDTYMFMNENMTYVNGDQYCLDHMFLTDVDSVYELMDLSMKSYDEDCAKIENRDVERYARYTKYDDAVIIIRTNSGRVIYKNIPVPQNNERAHEIENKLFSSKEFIDGYFSIKNVDISNSVSEENWNEFSNSYTNITLKAKEVQMMIECYKKDLDNFDYEQICNEGSLGSVYFTLDQGRGFTRYMRSAYFSIYPSMTNCVNYLKELGYETPDITAKDVASVSITYYEGSDIDYDDIEAYYKSNTYDYGVDDSKDVMYVDEADIEKLLPYMSLNEYSHKWGRGDIFEPAYSIEAEVSTSKLFSGNSHVVMTSGKGNTTVYFNFLKDQVPDFVKKDLGIE
jgi:ABC-2 type transport system permease protein